LCLRADVFGFLSVVSVLLLLFILDCFEEVGICNFCVFWVLRRAG